MTITVATTHSRACRAWLVLLVLFVGWSGWFVYRTSFVLEGTRYFSLFDDAMISSSYAMNLAEGRGLRWDGATEPVEGFTNPLWTLTMTASHLPFVPVRYRSLLVQLLSLALLVVGLDLVRRLMVAHFGARSDHPASWLPACVLTAGYYPLSYWSLMGMETALQACLGLLGTLLALDLTEKGRLDRSIPLGGLLGLAYLTRMDMSIWIVFVVGFVVWRRRGALRDPTFRIGMGILALAVLGYQGFRVTYFGDLLPNTYYLKMVGIPAGLRLTRGLPVTLQGLGLVLVAALLATVVAWVRRRKNPGLVLVVAPVWIASTYSVWVGGDAWEGAGIGANRFLVWTAPLLFVGLNGIRNVLAAGRSGRLRPSVTGAVTGVLLLVFLVVPGTATADRVSDLLVLRPPFHVQDHEHVLETFLYLERLVPRHFSVTTVYAGVPAVYTEFRLVDFLGYTDRWIAKQPPALPLETLDPRLYEPGHVKWDLDYVLDVRRPDVVLHTFGIPRDVIVPELERRGYRDVRGLWLAPWIRPPSRDGVSAPDPRTDGSRFPPDP